MHMDISPQNLSDRPAVIEAREYRRVFACLLWSAHCARYGVWQTAPQNRQTSTTSRWMSRRATAR